MTNSFDILSVQLDLNRAMNECNTLNEILDTVVSFITEKEIYSSIALLLKEKGNFVLEENLESYVKGDFSLAENRVFLRLSSAVGYRENFIGRLVIPLGKGVTGMVAEKGEQKIIHDINHLPKNDYIDAAPEDIEIRSEMSVPIRYKNHIIGVLDTQSEKIDAFRSSDTYALLNSISNELGRPIHRCLQNDTDLMTGFQRRETLDRLIDMNIKSAIKGTPFSIAYCDLDNFKDINDKYGHKTGDIVLKELGKYILGRILYNQKAIRIGGDEFLLIFPEWKKNYVSIFLDNINKELNKHFLDGIEDPLHLSYGILMCKDLDESTNIEEYRNNMLRKGDSLMYNMKQKR